MSRLTCKCWSVNKHLENVQLIGLMKTQRWMPRVFIGIPTWGSLYTHGRRTFRNLGLPRDIEVYYSYFSSPVRKQNRAWFVCQCYFSVSIGRKRLGFPSSHSWLVISGTAIMTVQYFTRITSVCAWNLFETVVFTYQLVHRRCFCPLTFCWNFSKLNPF